MTRSDGVHLRTKYIYLCGPYTLGDPVLNVRAMVAAAEAVVAAGHIPFVPLLDHLWHLASPHPWEYWIAERGAMAMIGVPVVVLTVEPGTTTFHVWVSGTDRTMRLFKVIENAGSGGEIAFPIIRGLNKLLDELLIKLTDAPEPWSYNSLAHGRVRQHPKMRRPR